MTAVSVDALDPLRPRPLGIDPVTWSRMSWHAQEQAIRRAASEGRLAPHGTRAAMKRHRDWKQPLCATCRVAATLRSELTRARLRDRRPVKPRIFQRMDGAWCLTNGVSSATASSAQACWSLLPHLAEQGAA